VTKVSNFEYRFVAVGGLERKAKQTGFNNYASGLAPIREWLPVEAKDFLSMTWQELEHVAHVIRDASKSGSASWKPFSTAPKVDYEIWVCTDLGDVEAILWDKEAGVWLDRDRHVYDPAKEGPVLWLDVPNPPYMDYPCIDGSTPVDKSTGTV
jgi:hypothetical protein